MTIFPIAFYASYFFIHCVLLDFGSRHRSPIGLDIACTLCVVGLLSRPYFTNSGMKDFTNKFDSEMLIVFLESIHLTMSQRGNLMLTQSAHRYPFQSDAITYKLKSNCVIPAANFLIEYDVYFIK